MSRPRQKVPELDGDIYWRGVDMRPERGPGYTAESVNMRYEEGKPKGRKGTVKVPWTNKIVGSGFQPWGTVYGKGEFKDADGVQHLITAADGNVYQSRSNNGTQQLTLPPGVTITSAVRFVQANHVLVMCRGLGLVPLVMTSLAAGFIERPATATPGTSSMPNALRGIWEGNRLWLQTANDEVWESDVLDIYTYAESGKHKINQGSVDGLVTIELFGKDIICFKGKSVFRLPEVASRLPNEIAAVAVTKRYGCVAAESVADVGSDMLWLTEELEVASLTLTELGEVQTASGVGTRPPMFSDPIDPLMKRIRAKYAGGAIGIFHNRKYYLAVPLDNAESFRPDLVGSAAVYRNGSYTVQLGVAGVEYKWTRGATEANLQNGAAVLTATGYFTAATQAAQLNASGPVNTAVTASVKRVYRGVNNAVLVYDFRNQAWAGHDEAEGLEVKEFFVAKMLDRPRLFMVGADGWVTLYEESFEDQLSQPYVEVVVTDVPSPGATVRVNGGTTITATANDNNQAGNLWGIGGSPSIATAGMNLWRDGNGNAGYYFGGWSAPNTAAIPVPNGVRFYATNGVVPTVALTGIHNITVAKVRTQAVRSRVRLRAYRTEGLPLARKRLPVLELHLKTWAPKVTVRLVVEGVGEEKNLATDETRDRTKFDRPAWAAPYAVSNAAGNFMAPYRQDYSVVWPAPGAGMKLTGGVKLDLHQDTTYRLRAGAGEQGWSPQIEIENTQGRVELWAAGIEGFEATRGKGVMV